MEDFELFLRRVCLINQNQTLIYQAKRNLANHLSVKIKRGEKHQDKQSSISKQNKQTKQPIKPISIH